MARALVCEDDADTRRLLVQLLKLEGDAVVETDTVAAALAVLDDRETEIDLVVADLGLPDGSGLEVCEAASRRGARVVVVTANPNLADVPALRACADTIITKPFTFEELFDALVDASGAIPEV